MYIYYLHIEHLHRPKSKLSAHRSHLTAEMMRLNNHVKWIFILFIYLNLILKLKMEFQIVKMEMADHSLGRPILMFFAYIYKMEIIPYNSLASHIMGIQS